MGKSAGKTILGLVGFAVGFANPAAFGFASSAVWSGALYGLSLGTMIWSATHKPKATENYSRFDTFMNSVDSNARIPVIYGTRKFGGLQSYHLASSDGKKLTKDIIISEGEIQGIYGVTANELTIGNNSTTKVSRIATIFAKLGKKGGLQYHSVGETHVFSLVNLKYSDAKIEIVIGGPTPEDKTLKLYANGKTTSILLQHPNDLHDNQDNDYSCYMSKLVNYIGGIGYTNSLASEGWKVVAASITTDPPENIGTIETTNCYNNPVSLGINKLASPDSRYVFNNGATTQDPPSNYMNVGGYRKMAWLRANLVQTEQLSGGNPNIAYVCQGIKICDTRTNTKEYSENPAMIVRDYLLSKTYGCGHFITADMLDEDAFKEAADYCDELVTYVDHNGMTITEPRYTLNIILDTKKKHSEHLQDMFANFGGFLVFTNNHIGLRVERSTEVSYAFTDDTIIEGSVTYTANTVEQTPNRYNITYYDPTQNWTGVKCLVENTVNQQPYPVGRGKIIPKDVVLTGCTRQSQALRLGRLFRDLAILCPIVATWQTSTMAMHLEPGDVVTITKNIVVNGESKVLFDAMPFRILEISNNKGIWTIKGQQYNDSIYHDGLGAKITVKNYVPIANPLSDAIPEVANIVLSQTYYKQKDGTVVSDINGTFDAANYQFVRQYHVKYSTDGIQWNNYAATPDNSFVIHNAKTLTDYYVRIAVENSVGRLSEGTTSEPIYITGKDLPPSNIPSITATQSTIDRTKVFLKWEPVNDIDLSEYRVMEGNDVIAVTTDTQFTYTATQSKTHVFSVVAVDNSGNPSIIPATTSIDVIIEPAKVAGFSALIQETDRSRLIFQWSPSADSKDIAFYEIRMGNEWEQGIVIATQLKATIYTHVLTTEGSQKYMIKAVSTAGYYSATYASQILQITLRPDAPMNLLLQQEPRDVSMLKLSFTASPGKDIDGYEVRLGTQWSTGTFVANIKETTYWYTLPSSGVYDFMVKARTVAGYLSNASNAAITVMIEPYDITGFTAVQMINDRTKVRLLWDPPNVSTSYVEIRQGNSWDTGVVLGTRLSGTFFDTIIANESIQHFWIKAISTAGHYSLYPAQVDGVYSLNPDPVSNIVLTQDLNDTSIVHINFTGISESDLKYYEIRYGDTWESSVKIGETKELRWDFQPTKTGDVKIMIKSLNNAGYYSDEASNHKYIILEPQSIDNFVTIQNGEYVEFYWDRPSQNDIVAYEIREGWSFDTGTLVASGITLNSHKTKIDFEKNYRYHIKAINRSNRYSIYSASQSIFVHDLPPKNVIETLDEITMQTGVKSGVEFGTSLINWTNIGGRFSDYPTTKFSDVGGKAVLKLAKDSNGKYVSTGTYTTTTKDVGKVITANISAQFVSTVLLRGFGTARLQMHTSINGSTWTSWQDFIPSQYTFRYIEFKVILGTNDVTKTPEVNQLNIAIDVPDVEYTGSDSVAIGGTIVAYGGEFYKVPVVTPTAIGGGLWADVVSKDKLGFKVVVRNINGNDVGGSIDWRAKGY